MAPAAICSIVMATSLAAAEFSSALATSDMKEESAYLIGKGMLTTPKHVHSYSLVIKVLVSSASLTESRPHWKWKSVEAKSPPAIFLYGFLAGCLMGFVKERVMKMADSGSQGKSDRSVCQDIVA